MYIRSLLIGVVVMVMCVGNLIAQWPNPPINITCNTRGFWLREYFPPFHKVNAYSINPSVSYYAFNFLDVGAHMRYNLAWSSGTSEPAQWKYSFLESGFLIRKIINRDIAKIVFFHPSIVIEKLQLYPLIESKFFFGSTHLFPNGTTAGIKGLALTELQNKIGILITTGKRLGIDVGIRHIYNPAINRHFDQFYINLLYSLIKK